MKFATKTIHAAQPSEPETGSLIAPIDGVHGWYLQNQGVKKAVVTLRLAGFYELVPPGQIVFASDAPYGATAVSAEITMPERP